MKIRSLGVVVSTALVISGCASLGKDGRVGLNDGSDACFVYLDRLDDTAIYYKDQRMTDIAAGVLIGGGTGAMAGLAIGRSDTAAIIGGITGAIAGGFAADAYWKNQLQKANNQAEQALNAVAGDVTQDINRLTSVDHDIAALVQCRIAQRDKIKKQFAERRLTLQQAQQEWKKWGDLIRKDQNEMKYLNEALDNIRKIEESYGVASMAAESGTLVTEEMQKRWQQELEMEQAKELANINLAYKEQIKAKRIKAKEKKKLSKKHKLEIAAIKTKYADKAASIKNKKNPNGNLLKPLVASVHEKQESIQKSKTQIDNLAIEASNDNGFEQIRSQLIPLNDDSKIIASKENKRETGTV